MTKIEQVISHAENCWSQSSKRQKKIRYLAVYTVLFFATFSIAYMPFLTAGKTFVWSADGRYQHLPTLVYVGRCLRSVFRNFIRGDFSVPLFDLNIQLGDSVIGALNGGFLGTDPLLVLSAFVPARYSEYLYQFLVVLRLYLAGLSFSFLCSYFGKRKVYTLIGSVIYCFSGYALFLSVWSPTFLNPLIILPLLIVGTDKILTRKSMNTLVFSVSYAALCGFYHLYMMTLMIVTYALVRFFELYKENRFKEFIRALGRGVFSYIIGICLSGIVFFPGVVEYFEAGRAGFSNYHGLYGFKYYIERLMRLIAPPSGWDDLSLAAIVLFAWVLLLCSKGKRSLKLLTLFVCLAYSSFGGLILNGFQYSSNRWTFGGALLGAFVTVEMLPELLHPTRKQSLICACVLSLYILSVFSTDYMRQMNYVLVGALFLTLIALIAILKAPENGNEGGYRRLIRATACLCLVVINIGINGVYHFASDQGNWSSRYMELGFESDRLNESVEREMEPYLLGNPEGRADSPLFSANYGMVWHIPGMLAFNSVLNANVMDFWQKVENCGVNQAFSIYSTDQQTISTTLLSEKYFITTEKSTNNVPYGYSLLEKTESGNLIYQNNFALPWGYTYDNAISYEALKKMNGLERQEMMLQAIALDEVESVNELKEASFESRKLTYIIKSSDCQWSNKKIVVPRANASITLSFDMPPRAEGYVRLKGFDINGNGTTSMSIGIKSAGISKSSQARSDQYDWYYGRENYLFNLGYSEKERTELTITFGKKGTYILDDIEIYALPMESYPGRVEALREEALENIQWGINRLSGTVNVSKDKILCISIPYNIGWSATVDGEDVEILRGNYMFMAIPLAAGAHKIELLYRTPGLTLGIVTTLMSALAIFTVALMKQTERIKRAKVIKLPKTQEPYRKEKELS